MTRALVGIGSNLGHSAQTLRAALDAFGESAETRVVAVSRFIETLTVGGPPDQRPYLNAAAVIETALDVESFARRMFEIETAQGRVRGERWGPRAIDLDLLLFDQQVFDEPELLVPHPRMSFRRFVLEPAAEIASEWVHPTSSWTIQRLRRHLDEPSSTIVLLAAPVYSPLSVLARVRGAVPSSVVFRNFAPTHDLTPPPVRANAADAPGAAPSAVPPEPRPKIVTQITVGLQPPTTPDNDAACRAWRAAFHAHVIAADLGPSLCLSGDDLNLAVAEISAAVAAMR